MSNDEDLKNLKEFAGLMMRWSRSAEERPNAFADKMDALAEAQANSEVKIAALADAQIRTEAAMETMAQRVGESMSALAAA